MKIHIFGSCSGTEPMPGRHHTSWAIEADDGSLYIFDAGEGCAHTAHNMGLDLTKIKAVFISHMHIDHLWGLPNLLWTPVKVKWYKKLTCELFARLFVPDMEKWTAMHDVISSGERIMPVEAAEISDGVIYDDGYVKVEALHNLHLGDKQPWRSYSFYITCEGKSIIFTGDIKEPDEIDAFFMRGCDMLLFETGHHKPDRMPKYLGERGHRADYLVYIHHGRDILYDPTGSDKLIRESWGGCYRIANDGDIILL